MGKDNNKVPADRDWSAHDYEFDELAALIDRIKTIFDYSYEAVFLVKVEDGEFRYFRCNKAYEKMTGLGLADIRGKTPVEVYGPEQGQKIAQQYCQVVDNKKTLQFEDEYISPAGTKTLRYNYVPVEFGEQIKYIAGACIDLTKQLETENQLQEMRRYEKVTVKISQLALRENDQDKFLGESLKILGEGTQASGALIITKAGRNNNAGSIYEWDRDEPTNRTSYFQHIPEQFLWASGQLCQGKALKYNDIETIPDENAKASLRELGIISLLIIPLLYGEACYGFTALGSRTERDWEIEAALLGVTAEIISLYLDKKQREYMLWMENQRFHALTSFTDDLFFEMDKELKHTAVHGRWLEKIGLSPELFIGRSDREIMGEEQAALHETANRRALQGEPAVYEWEYDGEKVRNTIRFPLHLLRTQKAM